VTVPVEEATSHPPSERTHALYPLMQKKNKKQKNKQKKNNTKQQSNTVHT